VKYGIRVEAEHNELILENSFGDKVIIPADKREWVQNKMKNKCHTCLDEYIATLPTMAAYAEEGTVVPPPKKKEFVGISVEEIEKANPVKPASSQEDTKPLPSVLTKIYAQPGESTRIAATPRRENIVVSEEEPKKVVEEDVRTAEEKNAIAETRKFISDNLKIQQGESTKISQNIFKETVFAEEQPVTNVERLPGVDFNKDNVDEQVKGSIISFFEDKQTGPILESELKTSAKIHEVSYFLKSAGYLPANWKITEELDETTRAALDKYNRQKYPDTYGKQSSPVSKLDEAVSLGQLEYANPEDLRKIQAELSQRGYYSEFNTPKIKVSDYKTVDEIKALQSKLVAAGIDIGKYGPKGDGVDGIIGPRTKAGIAQYNERQLANADAIMGDKTRAAFRAYLKDQTADIKPLGIALTPTVGTFQDDKGASVRQAQKQLYSSGYFRLEQTDLDLSEPTIMVQQNLDVSQLRLSQDLICKDKRCTAFVGDEISKNFGSAVRAQINFSGHAWTVREHLLARGAQELYNVFPEKKPKITNPDAFINMLTKNAPKVNADIVQGGDIISLYYGHSGSSMEAYRDGGRTFSTHTGIIKTDENGTKYVEHNIRGTLHRDRLEDMISGKVKTVSGKGNIRITGVIRPYYHSAKEEFSPTKYGINKNEVTNKNTSLTTKPAAQFAQVLINNKEALVGDTPVNDVEFESLVRALRVIGWKESTYKPQPKPEYTKVAADVREKVGGREASIGYIQIKDEENIIPEIRQNLGIDNETLKTPQGAAIAGYYSLSTKYAIIRDSLVGKGDFTSDDITQLAMIAWNEPVQRVIDTAVKYKNLPAVLKAYEDSYAKDNRKFPYARAIEAYNAYIQ